jgi:hypothetical protein
LKFKGDIKSSLLYDVGICKNELDEYKENYEKIYEENIKIKNVVKIFNKIFINFLYIFFMYYLIVYSLKIEKLNYKNLLSLKDI